MPPRPPIAVVLPFRNAQATLEAAIDSILSQRGVDVTLLAIDDGSRDGSLAQAQRTAAQHGNVQLLRTRGQGLVAALRLGCETATTEFIARMDADDISLPDRLAQQVETLRADPHLGALGTRVEAFPDTAVGDGLAHYLAWQNSLLTPADHRRELFVESPLCHPSTVLRRSALQAVGGYRDGDFPEDYDLWLRLTEAGFGLAKRPEILLRWRHHPGQLSFQDPRYAPARFLALKAPHLARWARSRPGPLTVWGAGRTGKHLVRALEPHGVGAARFIDIDPAKIGRRARGAPVVAPDDLAPGQGVLVVAVGARGARAEIRAHLVDHGFVEGQDFICAA